MHIQSPKRGFFYRADFDVKNGFWVKEVPLNTKVATQQIVNKELKYPTFEDFLDRISTDNIYKKKINGYLGRNCMC